MSRNGAVLRAPGLVSRPVSARGLYLSGPSQDIGQDQDRSTGTAYARQTGALYVYTPLLVSAVLWDVRTTQTYTCQFVTAGDGTTVAFVVQAGVTVDSFAEDWPFIPAAGDFLLLPGKHFLQLKTDDARTVLWRDNGADEYNSAEWGTAFLWYTTNAYATYTLPVKLRCRPLYLSGFTEYEKL